MSEDERKWQLFEEHMRQVEEEQKPQPDLFFQRSIGCIIGGILGPVVLFALLIINDVLHPDAEEGGILTILIFFIMAVLIGGIVTGLLSPFVVRRVKKWWVLASALTFLLFFIWNLALYVQLKANPPLMDLYEECGFPFGFYGFGGFVGISQFLWIGLLADFAFALIVSIGVGIICDRIYRGMQTKNRN